MSDRSERRFVRAFENTDGWKAQRAAASGSATEAELPDVTFAHLGIAFAAEEKTTSAPYIRLEEREVEELNTYAETFGMLPVIIGRFKGERAWYLWNPDDMERTDSGNYRGSKDDGKWAAKVAHPDGTADGVYPSGLTSFHLRHAVRGELGGGITEPAKNTATVGSGGGSDG